MDKKTLIGALLLSLAGTGAAVAAKSDVPKHALPVSTDGDVVIGLCDGETTREIDGLKDGQSLSRADAQALSDTLMSEWQRKNPGQVWVAKNEQAAPAVKTGKENAASGALQVEPGKGPMQDGHTYGNFSERDAKLWAISTQKAVDDGNKVFHDAKELGGTVGISCDMCHPDGANTHPETYPKYQVQLGRVALLRDMINWCIENPVRGKPLPDEDPKMKAMEAYIYAQRRGTPLEYGKH